MKKPKSYKSILYLSLVLNILYLLWRTLFTIPRSTSILVNLLAVLLLLSEAVSIFTAFVLFWSRSKPFELELPRISDADYPEVDIFIATHNESYELLFKTVNACTYLKYPDKSKVHIYVSDDTNRPEIRELAASLGVNYIGMENNKHAKSGNLNNALAHSFSPLIVTFDADMIPKEEFLLKSVPYFLIPEYEKREDGEWIRREEPLDDRIGFIQTPQNFYNPDVFHYNLSSESRIPNEQDFFSREVNVSNNAVNAPIYTGSNTVISRQAIKDAGGFPLHTITEDFELGVRIQSNGYRSYATDVVLASGLTPETIEGVIKQRVRWARGVIQSVYNVNLLFNPKLSGAQKITYFTSYLYWWSFLRRIMYIIAPVLFALFNVRLVDNNFWILLLMWAPAYFSMNYYMQHLAGNIRTQRWGEIYETILAPFMVIPVFLESIGFSEKKFKVTNKSKSTKNTFFNVTLMPHMILLLLSILALIRFNIGKYGSELLFGSVIDFWLVHHIINLSYAVFFGFNRIIHRQYPRFPKSYAAILTVDTRSIAVETLNVSDEGVALRLESKLFIPMNKLVSISLDNGVYRAEVTSRLVRIHKAEQYYIYSFKHEKIDNLREYYQLVYDQINESLPLARDKWYTELDALEAALNGKRRVQKKVVSVDFVNVHRDLDGWILEYVDDYYLYFTNTPSELFSRDRIIVDFNATRYELHYVGVMTTDNHTLEVFEILRKEVHS